MSDVFKSRVYWLVAISSLVMSTSSGWSQDPGTPAETTDKLSSRIKYEKLGDVIYATPEDIELKLDAYIPKGDGPFPAMLVVHGGGWNSGSKSQLSFHARSLADRGYATFAINYRLAPKYPFPAQIEDCRAAVKWIREHAAEHKVDPDRIGAFGYSAGGHLVTLLATTGEKKSETDGVDTTIQAACAGGAPTEFRSFKIDSTALAYWLGGSRRERPARYDAASSARFATPDSAPIFFFNGTNDLIVPIAWTIPLYEALQKAGVDTELYEVDGKGHIFAAMNVSAINEGWRFLDRYLQPQPAETSSAQAE